jgi:hypothetical protein
MLKCFSMLSEQVEGATVMRAPFFHQMFFLATCVCRGAFVFIESLLLAPCIFRGASFFIGGLYLASYIFRGASFFHWRSLFNSMQF